MPFKLVTLGDFWTRIAKTKQNFENTIAETRKCLTKFSRILECGAEDACQKRFPWFSSPREGGTSFLGGKRMDRIRIFLWKACHKPVSSRQNERSNVAVRCFTIRRDARVLLEGNAWIESVCLSGRHATNRFLPGKTNIRM